jgi:hypothetical protein
MRVLALAAVCACTFASACAPAVLTPDEIVAAFVAASQDDARTMHMEWTGAIHTNQPQPGRGVTASDISFVATFEFAGPDYEGVMTTSMNGMGMGSSTTSYAQVGGANFTRFEGGDWQGIPSGAGPTLAFDPLAGLSAAGVAYEAPDTISGTQVHRIRVADPLGALQRTLFQQGAFTEVGLVDGGASDYLVYVDAQGIPVAARLVVDVTMQVMIDPAGDGSNVEYGMTSDYVFSDWGAPITIIAPPVTSGGFDDFPPPPKLP